MENYELMAEILSIAVMEPYDGKEDEFVRTLQEFYAVLRDKKYSRDELMKNKRTPHYVNIRYWASEEARRSAHEDPDVHKFWARLGLLCQMRAVYETLDQVPGFVNP
jgi:hypothetical protein